MRIVRRCFACLRQAENCLTIFLLSGSQRFKLCLSSRERIASFLGLFERIGREARREGAQVVDILLGLYVFFFRFNFLEAAGSGE